jgi:hypothetical protein
MIFDKFLIEVKNWTEYWKVLAKTEVSQWNNCIGG